VPRQSTAARRWAALPANSLARRALPTVDYCDVFSAEVDGTATVEGVARQLFSGRPPRLMRLRDALVRPFGLKTSPRGPRAPLRLMPGERVGLFTVFECTEDELLLGEDDRHLDFRICLRVAGDGEASLTTLVRFRNLWGRAYFFLVRPFHARIVKRMLGRAAA
jgi:hypothetical protein